MIKDFMPNPITPENSNIRKCCPDEQIKELARELCGEGEYYQDCFHCPTLRCCGTQKFARELYNKGWRKASEVIDEVEQFIFMKYGEYFNFAELKKKYTEGGRDKIAEFGKYSPLSWKNTEEGK